MRQIDSIYGRANLRAPSTQLAVSRFVSRTYGWMFLGLMLTGLVSYAIVSSESALEFILGNRLVFYGAIAGELALVMGVTAAFNRLSASAATWGFLAYAALNGVTMGMIFMVYTMTSIGQVFMISAAMFGGLALFGT